MPAVKVKIKKPHKEALRHSQSLKKKKRVGMFILISFLSTAALAGAIYLFYWPAITIQTILVQGNNIIDSQDLSHFVEEELKGNYWLIFPKKSILVYPRQKIEKDLLSQFPRLNGASLSLSDWSSLVLDVSERDTDTIWCSESKNDTPDSGAENSSSTPSSGEGNSLPGIENGCYFADNQGFIFARSPQYWGSVFTEIYGLLPPNPIGSQPLTPPQYSVVVNFAKNLTKIFDRANLTNFRLIKIQLISQTEYHAVIWDSDLRSEWLILFDSDGNPEMLTSNLYSVLSSRPFLADLSGNKAGLESIDLRYGNRVFYRFK